MNELEARLTAALSAQADSVQPEDLSDLALPATVPPTWRRTTVLLAVAACLAVVGILTVVLRTPDSERPQPAEPRPSLEIPADIGKDWDRSKGSQPADLDLDGDGTPERVRFLAEPSKEYDGRVRLQTTLSSDGSSAHGIVDLGTTLGLFALDPIDADSDGDEELVLFQESVTNGVAFAGPPLARPVVLDLRDGLLVEAPATEPDRLFSGSVISRLVPGADTDHYDLVWLQDFWIEDGVLLSSRSALDYPAVGMDLVIPEFHRADVVEWRLAQDGVLSPVAASTPCLAMSLDGRQRPCADGEPDALPPLGPVAEERIGIGEEFSSQTPFPFVVRLDAVADPAVAVEMPDGSVVQQGLELGGAPEIYTVTPSAVFRHGGISLLARGELSDGEITMQVLAQDGRDLRPLSLLGDVPLGIGRTDDALSYRTWLTEGGALLTAVATDATESQWSVHSWMLTGRHEMGPVPIGVVCFDDADDPATGRRC